MTIESRADQVARIRRNGLLPEDLELELIRAERRGASRQPRAITSPAVENRVCLPRRVLEYLSSREGTAQQIADALGAGLNQTHRAIARLLRERRIAVVRTIETAAYFGPATRVLGLAPVEGGGAIGSSADFTDAGERARQQSSGTNSDNLNTSESRQ